MVSTLTAVLASPPTTSGERTMRRLDLARQCLGLDQFIVVNLFARATYRTTDISIVGGEERDWASARPAILSAVTTADAVLLAYGISEPTGDARALHRLQVTWLSALIETTSTPVHLVGRRPRHPTRWHRWTRLEYPGVPFAEALRIALTSTQASVEVSLDGVRKV